VEDIGDYKEVENLKSLKMEKGLLYETIVTTLNVEGVGNAAPIVSMKLVIKRVFAPSFAAM